MPTTPIVDRTEPFGSIDYRVLFMSLTPTVPSTLRQSAFIARLAMMPMAALLSVALATSSIGQDLTTPFDFFDQNCLAPGPRFDEMEAKAAKNNWSPLPEQVLQVLTPIANPSSLSGWIASDENEKIKVVVVSKGVAGSKPVEGCTIGFYGVDTRAFENSMANRAGPGTNGSQDAPNRINVIFNSASNAGLAEFVTLSLPEKVEGPDQVIASVLSAVGSTE
jgi:hypothetical protein